MRLLCTLGAVTGTSLCAVLNCSAVICTTNDLVANARKVADTATADKHNGVLLKVVPLAGDVGGNLDAVDKTYTSNLTKRRVRLLRGCGENAGANATLLRVVLQGGVLGFGLNAHTTLADELVDSRQDILLLIPIYVQFHIF